MAELATLRTTDHASLMQRVAEHATRYLTGLPVAGVVPPARSPEQVTGFDVPLQAGPLDPLAVLDELVAAAGPGLVGTGGGRFFGFVVGGAMPAALAADMVATAWDQNAGLRALAPAACAAEDAVERWVLDLLDLPRSAVVGLVPGGMSANFTCLAAARTELLRRAGWDVNRLGLVGSPPLEVLVNAERHETVDRSLRLLGHGAPTPVDVDAQGRVDPAAMAAALARVPPGAPLLVSLYAGHIHSGGYDDFASLVPMVRARGGWVHVDGAIGLWSAATPRLRHLTAGMAGADSWATDAHKTLNVPYDCGIAVVADPAAMSRAMSIHAEYAIGSGSGVLQPYERTPEWSRRARGFGIWAALRGIGRDGVAELVEGLHDAATGLAAGLAEVPGLEVLNEVEFTQVCVAGRDDDETHALVEALLSDGRTWISGSVWHGRAVLRVSVSSWRTGPAEVEETLDAVRAAVEQVRTVRPPLPASPAAPS